MPFCVKPAKDSFVEIFAIDDSKNKKIHFLFTFCNKYIYKYNYNYIYKYKFIYIYIYIFIFIN